MPKPWSDDLRCRILDAYERKEGSQREVSRRFGVSFEYVRKIRKQWRGSGQKERMPQSRHGRLSRMTDAVQERLRGWLREQPDRTLAELQEQLQASGVVASRSRIGQVLQQMGLRQKKTLPAAERDTEANRKRREEFLATITAIPVEKLIFLDESGVTTQMTRQWGRAPKGERILETTPQGRWTVLTTLGAMSLRGIDAAMTIPSATDGDIFRVYVKQVLSPKLKPGDAVVMDNLSAHKVAGIRRQIEACGARLIYLPPYSPDLNPIEQAWSKFKQFLRSAKARTDQALDQAVSDALKTISAENAAVVPSLRLSGYTNQGTALSRVFTALVR